MTLLQPSLFYILSSKNTTFIANQKSLLSFQKLKSEFKNYSV